MGWHKVRNYCISCECHYELSDFSYTLEQSLRGHNAKIEYDEILNRTMIFVNTSTAPLNILVSEIRNEGVEILMVE